MFLIVVDAHSMWPEVIEKSTTSSKRTIEVLRQLFARFGLPEQLVSDTGTQFTSKEFAKFTKANGIKHICTTPYHPRWRARWSDIAASVVELLIDLYIP